MDWELFGYVIATFAIAIIGGLIPFLIKLIPNKQLIIRIIDILSVGAAGLFLGGGIFHMLGEGLHYIDDSGIDTGNYPLGYTLFGVTFFLIFFVDRVIVPHSHSSFQDLEDNNENEYQKLNDEEELHVDHHHGHDHGKTKEVSEWIPIVVLYCALGIHSFLEGLGLGSTDDYTMIFVAIAAHKWADSGLSIIYLMRKIKQWWILLIFLLIMASFTPLGALVGKCVISSLEDDSASLMTQGIFCCIAAGSFIFVSIVEILCEGFEEHSNKHIMDKYLKFGLAFLLFLLMSLTPLLEGDHHHHHDDSSLDHHDH